MISRYCYAGAWSHVDSETLHFSGEVVAGDLDALRAEFGENTKVIVVDSPGGLTTEGIQIGRFLVNKKITVVVDGICMSSCANYIFAVADRKVIRNGVVGFHGDMNAFVHMLDRDIKSTKELAAKLGEDLSGFILKSVRVAMELPPGLSAAETWAEYEKFKVAARDEEELFRGLGISQDFFERTERDDKGMGDGRTYEMLLPSPATFLHYGFRNIEGQQSRELISKDPRFLSFAGAGWPVVID